MSSCQKRFIRNREGSMMVFEAIIVAVLILTSVIFYTTLQRPTNQIQPGGIDLGEVSADTLLVLEATEFQDPLDSGRDMPYEEWLQRVMQGEAAVVDLVINFLDEVLPTGTQYQYRIDNGHGNYLLAPEAEDQPRNARASSRIATPDWSTYQANAGGASYNPSEALDFSGFTALRSPAGSDTAPDGSTWLASWAAAEPGLDRVPEAALYGTWEYDALGCIPCYFDVTDQGVLADVPVYYMQLVVWFGV